MLCLSRLCKKLNLYTLLLKTMESKATDSKRTKFVIDIKYQDNEHGKSMVRKLVEDLSLLVRPDFFKGEGDKHLVIDLLPRRETKEKSVNDFIEKVKSGEYYWYSPGDSVHVETVIEDCRAFLGRSPSFQEMNELFKVLFIKDSEIYFMDTDILMELKEL